RAVALKKLGKLLGKSMGYRVDLKAPDKDDRAEALAKLKEARVKRDALSKQREARMAELLRGDAEFQRLKSECAEAQKECDGVSDICKRMRFAAGILGQLFFSVKAKGDTWEDVIDTLPKDRFPQMAA